MSVRLTSIAFAFLLAGLLGRLVLSNPLLDALYPYSAEGGAWFQKVHPATLLLLSGVIFVAAVKGVARFTLHSWRSQRHVVIYLVTVVAVGSISTWLHGLAGTAYLIDTFMAAGLYVLLLGNTTLDHARKLALVGFLVAGINALVALAEYAIGANLLPQSASFGFFRASALFGHPLTNGLMMATCLAGSLALPRRLAIRAGYASLCLASLFAFGARGALLVSVLCLSVYLLALPVTGRIQSSQRLLLVPVSFGLLLIFAFALTFMLFGSNLGATITSRMSGDQSTDARLQSLDLLMSFSTTELVGGVDAASLAYLADAAGVPIIENFWVILLLRVGAPMLIALVAAAALLLRRQAQGTGFIGGLTCATFILVASTNNSLATKSGAFLMLAALLPALIPSSQVRRDRQEIL